MALSEIMTIVILPRVLDKNFAYPKIAVYSLNHNKQKRLLDMNITDLRTFVNHFCTHFEPLWILRLQKDDWVKRHRPSKMSLSETLVVSLYSNDEPI